MLNMLSGINITPNAPAKTLVEVANLAEELGFSTLYVADQGFSRDIFTTLTLLAASTKSIRLGPGITHPYTRHPVVAAVATASIDEISGGRAFLGIGAGGSRTLNPLQIDQKSPLRTCREAVEIARQLWSEKRLNYQGRYFQVVDAGIDFTTRSNIEIHWAARGPKMLALGGEIADAILLNGIPHFELENVIASIKEGAERANRSVRLNYNVPFVYDESSREMARAKTVYRVVDSPPHIKERLNLSPEIIEEIRKVVSLKGPSAAAYLLSDEILDQFVLEGEPSVCAEKLRTLFGRYGLDGIIVDVPDLSRAASLLPFAADVIAQANLEQLC